jgi:hypothetical protein
MVPFSAHYAETHCLYGHSVLLLETARRENAPSTESISIGCALQDFGSFLVYHHPMPDSAGWFPVFTLLLGYATKYISDWLQNRRLVERERETRRDARRDALAEARRQFQRQTLLDLQPVVFDVARNAGLMRQFDMNNNRQMQIWQTGLYPDDLAEGRRIAVARTSMLLVRVSDPRVRDLAVDFRNSAVSIGSNKSRDELIMFSDKMAVSYEELQERIGEVLRELDAEDFKTEERLTKNG